MEIINLTDENFQGFLSQNSKVVVKYYADWCGSCKLFAPKFKRLAADPRFSSVAFAEVNAEEQEQARKTAGVDNLPFFAVFRDGKLLAGSATSKEEVLVELLEKLNA